MSKQYMLFILFYLPTLCIIKDEQYEYNIGQLLVDSSEQFITKMEFDRHINFQPIRQKDNIVIFQENLTIKGIQLCYQGKIYQESIIHNIWVLEETNQKYYLGNLIIDGDQKLQNIKIELLTNNLTCFGVQFISDDQIVIDCTDQNFNILVIQNITRSSTFIIKYGNYIQGRRLFIINRLNVFVVDRNHIYHICKMQNTNQFKVCQIYKIEIDPFYGYSNGDTDWLIVFGLNNEIIEFRYTQITKMKPNQLRNRFIDTIIFDENQVLMICKDQCTQYIQILGEIKTIIHSSDYMVIQNDTNIFILSNNKQLNIIYHEYDQDIIIIQQEINQVHILSQNYKYKIYQLSSISYFRADKNMQLKINIHQIKISSQVTEMKNWILIDDRFAFRKQSRYMPFVGGNLNISFQSQDDIQFRFNYLKQLISLNCSNNNINAGSYDQIVFYFYCSDEFQSYQINTDQIYLKIKNKLFDQFINQYPAYLILKVCHISTFNIQLIIKNDNQMQFVSYFNSELKILRNFTQDFTILDCQQQAIVALNDKTNELNQVQNNDRLSRIQLSQNITYVKSDIKRRLLMGIQNNQLIIYILNFNYYSQLQTITICQDFIDYLLLDLYLIIICQNQIIKYNQITEFYFQKAGNIIIYEQKFNEKSKIISSGNSYFYILFQNSLSIFDASLPLKFSMIHIQQIQECINLYAFDIFICGYCQQQFICYQIVNQVQIQYDEDKFEYNQIINVNICAQNIFDNVCLEKPYRIQQKNHKIILKQQKLNLYIEKNTNSIRLNRDIIIGSVEKMEISKFQFQRQCDFVKYLQIEEHYNISIKIAFLYEYRQYLMYIFKKTSLIILNTMELNYKIINLGVIIKLIFVYESHLFVQSSGTQLYVFQCNIEFDCILVATQNFTSSILKIIQIQNNLLTLYYGCVFYQYQIFPDQNQMQYIQIVKQYKSSHLFIDVYTDIQTCEVNINFDNKLYYIVGEKQYYFDFKDIFYHLGTQISFENISIIKIINCKIIFIGTDQGFYFLRLNKGNMPKVLSELVLYKTLPQISQQIKLYDEYILFQYRIMDELIIYLISYNEMAVNKFIFHSYIQQIGLFQNHQTVYNQGLKLIMLQQNIFHLKVLNLDHSIILEEGLTQENQFNVTFTNSNQKEILQIQYYYEKDFKYAEIILDAIIMILISVFICLRVIKLRCKL